MFDLIMETGERPLRKKAFGPKVLSMAVHAVVVTLVIVIPLLRVTNTLPEMPVMMAFVTSAPDAAPPPPPPPASAAPKGTAKHVITTPANTLAAPVVAPSEIAPEVARVASAGVEGGIEGGVEGGVLGGIVGGLVGTVSAPPPPPPPPPAPAPRGPVRIGGQLTAPALLKRVEPVYPEMASAAQLTGLMILEATVGTDGCVESVRLLRSRHPFLDKAAVEALKQWQYTPLVLNATPTPFVLTVTFNFSVTR
jgi:periplasmic protein TonB